ncbi:MAG TPA: OmpA family protein, partial [Candidatus Obscuribacter sp.]|nr:OmpA family protein [Candidatus Obscuribacter sp.]
ILFDFDSDRLRPHSKEILLSLSRYLKKDKALKLQVEGHTCTIGGYDYNMQLSRKRAQSVRRYLTESCSIEAERLKAVGLGYTKPEKSNATSAGRERNRRVVFREIK